MVHFEPTIGHLILPSGLLGPANQLRADHFHKHYHGNLAENELHFGSHTLNTDWMDFPTQIALNRASLSYSDNQRWERRCGTDHCGLSGRNGHGYGAEKTAAMMIDFFGCFGRTHRRAGGGPPRRLRRRRGPKVIYLRSTNIT